MGINGKYFIAVVLRGNSFDRAEEIKGALLTQFNLRGALRSPAHITLHRPFEWKQEKEGELISRLGTFSFQGGFEIALRGFSHFRNRVVFINVLAAPGLAEMHRALTAHCRRELKLLNEYEDERGFHPHVTVAFRDLKKRHFNDVMQFVEGYSVNEIFRVEGFSLLRLEDKWKELRFFPLVAAENELYNLSK